MSYIKPQTPLQHKDGDYFYPLTTIDQVIMEDGITRLNGADLISINTNGASEGETVKVNADTLGGYSADNFIKNTEEINADTLGGYGADEFAKLSDLENLDTSSISMELLWENASPNSEFGAQTITFDKKYDFYKILFYGMGSDSANIVTDIIDNGGYLQCIQMGGSQNFMGYRTVNRNETSLIFSDGKYTASGLNNIGVKGNNICIPLKIYGIKGVSA